VLLHESRRGATHIADALAYVTRAQRRHSTLFLVSDFLVGKDEWARLETALRVASQRHDVIAVTLEDPRELTLPDAGLVELRDLETGERRLVDSSSRRVREAYASQARERREARASALRRLGVDEVVVDVGGDWVEPLVSFFQRRERRARRRGGG
jgi:uncharacterized protein (DUF58 family)